MALTVAQRLAREGKLSASRVAPLMTGNKEKILEVWRELCGDPTYQEENLDDVWPVQLGVITEPLNLAWYTKITGHPLTRQGEVVVHPDYDYACATLDGFDALIPGPVECKTVGGFETIEKVVQRYMPQVMWQLEVTQCKQAVLSVIEGGRVPRLVKIDYDKDYADELMARANKFMVHVRNMTPPVDMDEIIAPTLKSRKVDYNFTGNNSWAAAANDWLTHKSAAKTWDQAVETLRSMVPPDAASVTGYGIVASKDRANRISIKPISDSPAKPKPNNF